MRPEATLLCCLRGLELSFSFEGFSLVRLRLNALTKLLPTDYTNARRQERADSQGRRGHKGSAVEFSLVRR